MFNDATQIAFSAKYTDRITSLKQSEYKNFITASSKNPRCTFIVIVLVVNTSTYLFMSCVHTNTRPLSTTENTITAFFELRQV